MFFLSYLLGKMMPLIFGFLSFFSLLVPLLFDNEFVYKIFFFLNFRTRLWVSKLYLLIHYPLIFI